MPKKYKATLFTTDAEKDRSPEFLWVQSWIKRWGEKVTVNEYSSGGWEHVWFISGTKDALAEVPLDIRASSDWSGLNWYSELFPGKDNLDK